jgi:sterol desaturase/sphingolipid hydroxylase (fatty acid hydroxylase superfamily)
MLLRTHSHAALFIVAAFVAAMALEIAAFAVVRKRYAWREAAASLGVAILQRIGTGIGALALVPLYGFVWAHRVATLGLPVVAEIFVAFLLVEFAYYWMHRASHSIGWMWATHSVHHSAQQLNLPAAVRLGATGFVSFEWVPFVPLVLVGIPPQIVGGLLAFNLFYQFFLHSELIPRLGPLEWIFNTPSHHRVHHARNERYLDRNFGGVLIVYDRLFGSYVTERSDDPPVFGLVREERGYNPLNILFAGWMRLFERRAQGTRERYARGSSGTSTATGNVANSVAAGRLATPVALETSIAAPVKRST